jgi:hypothetical protein
LAIIALGFAGGPARLDMIDWNIQARSHACQACHRPFTDKEPFHTLLFDERHGYQRLDVCEDCWKAQYSQGAVDKKGFISHWQSVYTPPPAAPPDAIQKDTAETLLRKLVEQNSPEHAGARFILAVMLERKRILKVKTQLNENGVRVFIYEHARSGDLFSIADPKLELNHLEQVQKDVAHLLEHGLNAPAPAEGAQPAAAPDTSSQPPENSQATQAGSQARSENPEPASTSGL